MYAEKALKIATEAHKGQKDKGGQDYILHPIAVASYMDTDNEKTVAYLHDVLEDTIFTLDDLKKYGFPIEVLSALTVLTKDKTISYQKYIENVNKNKIAKKVKVADLLHNLDISRIQNPSKKDFERCEKYKSSILYLATH